MRPAATLSGLLCLLPALSMGCAVQPDATPEVEVGDAGIDKIYHGSRVGVCGWPTTVSTGGCTGALIHERAISTAQHCPTPSRVTFGENRNGSKSVRVVRCVGEGSSDAQICELAQAVTDIPVTPVLFGCEIDEYLKRDRNVVVAGFGRREDGGSGRKDWANQNINRVTNSSVIVGPHRGERASLCNGDSGGPAFVKVDDGSWRVIGTTRGNWSGPSCQEETEYKRTDPVVRNFENRTGIDITPCFDSRTGAWDPGPECGGFFAGDHQGSGRWSNWCSGTPASGYSAQCGAPFGGGGGGGGGGSCHDGAPGSRNYCSDSCPCDEGEGDCDRDTQCTGNLVCEEQGTVDRCVRSGGGGGGSCHDGAPGSRNYCSDSCPCDEGEGDCDRDSQCTGNLVCEEQGTVDRCVVADGGGTPDQPALQMSQGTYEVDQQIVVTFENVPSGDTHWVGIYPAGASHEDIDTPDWAWTNGSPSGTVRFAGRSQAGEYEARLFFNDSFDLEASVSFRVQASQGGECRDRRRSSDCRRWASQGWCERDPDGMLYWCCAACEARR